MPDDYCPAQATREETAVMKRAQLAELHTLQRLDLDLERTVAEAEALRHALATDRTAPARSRVARAGRAAETSAGQVRAAETTLAETRERLKRQETRLYGGQVSAKDISRAEQEIAHLKELVAAQEDTLLAAMLAAEEDQGAVTERRRALAEEERLGEAERREASAKLEQTSARLAALHAQRDAQASRVASTSPELLARYEAIRRSHGGRAVAEVRGGVCSACRVTLTAAALQRARLVAELPLCDNCGRILYLA
jgi:predicted  nucleic acid-binding Zn-ribbon protein